MKNSQRAGFDNWYKKNKLNELNKYDNTSYSGPAVIVHHIHGEADFEMRFVEYGGSSRHFDEDSLRDNPNMRAYAIKIDQADDARMGIHNGDFFVDDGATIIEERRNDDDDDENLLDNHFRGSTIDDIDF